MLAASGVPVLGDPTYRLLPPANEDQVRASLIGVATKSLKVEGLEIKELSENSGNAAVAASMSLKPP
ncbi:hypothetical protein DL768_008486 [Monosporascus sp. mg162]|nr:hypothetical protein DL768_008486 [Monosporascus sp. mg162]